ncbi:MAG: GapR family DNA-binding domain-containing protein [Alphaproteobacteria bacterium]
MESKDEKESEQVKQLDFLKNKDSRIADFAQRIKRLKAEKENIEDDIKKIYEEATKVGIAIS